MAGSAAWGILTERFSIQRLLTANVIGNGLIFLLLYWAVQFKFDGGLGTAIIFCWLPCTDSFMAAGIR